MNKRQIMELIDRMFELGYTCPYETTKLFVREYEKLNEPQKAKIPQVIAEYIEQKKNKDYHLLGAMTEIRSHKNKEIDDWFYTDDNIELFAQAWLDGYEVEKEKKYKKKNLSFRFSPQRLSVPSRRVRMFVRTEPLLRRARRQRKSTLLSTEKKLPNG